MSFYTKKFLNDLKKLEANRKRSSEIAEQEREVKRLSQKLGREPVFYSKDYVLKHDERPEFFKEWLNWRKQRYPTENITNNDEMKKKLNNSVDFFAYSWCQDPNFKKNHWVKQRDLPCLAPFYEVDPSGKVEIDIGHVYMIMQEYGRFKNRRPWDIVSRQVYWDLYVKEQKKIIDDYNKKYKPKTPIKYFPWLQTYDEVFYDNPDEPKTDKRIIKKEIQKKINEYLEEDPYEKTQSENQPEEIVANDDEDYVLEDEDPEAEQKDYRDILREIDEGYKSDESGVSSDYENSDESLFEDEGNFVNDVTPIKRKGGKKYKTRKETRKYFKKTKKVKRKILRKKKTYRRKHITNYKKRTRRRHST